MKWTFIIQQKIKLILLLTSLIILIGVTNYIEQRNINQIHQSFNSIYYDRLVPATELMRISQNIYQQRILMEHAVRSTNPDLRNLENRLTDLVSNTHDRVNNFEKTFLVQHESYALVLFKRSMQECEALEEAIVHKLDAEETDEARALYNERLSRKFSETILKVEDLVSIQTSVGHDMLEQSKNTISNSTLVLTLQIVAAVLIGVMAHGLIIASRLANVNVDKFHLN